MDSREIKCPRLSENTLRQSLEAQSNDNQPSVCSIAMPGSLKSYGIGK